MDKLSLDPGALAYTQTAFLQNLVGVMHIIAGYAINLLYIFATLELVIFGLAWALLAEVNFGRLFFKVIKIALIFFVIQNYIYLQNVIIQSMAQIGGILAHTKNLNVIVFDPARLWKYGYDTGLFLLKMAVTSNSIGLALIQIILGFGILLVFGLLIIQVAIQVIGFYLVTLTGLVFLPFGVFSYSNDMFDKTVQSVLKAGVKVMVIILILGVAINVWHDLNLLNIISNLKKANMNQFLGLFFTGLLFLVAALKLPKMAADVVGKISSSSSPITPAPTVTVNQTAAPTVAISGAANMQAATQIDTRATPAAGFAGSSVPAAVSVTTSTAAAGAPIASGGGAFAGTGAGGNMLDASKISKSISDTTIKQVQQSLKQMLKHQ